MTNEHIETDLITVNYPNTKNPTSAQIRAPSGEIDRGHSDIKMIFHVSSYFLIPFICISISCFHHLTCPEAFHTQSEILTFHIRRHR